MIKINDKFGIVFWVTGLAGSGKTTIAKKMKSKIQKIYGPTIVLSGDEIRSIFDMKGYTYGTRMSILAGRPCPIQISFLGHPGTTATDYIDYLILDD